MSALTTLTGSVLCERQGVVVSLQGELDIATAPQLRALMDAALAFASPQVTVDMAGVTFLDAQALTILGRSSRRLTLSGARMVIRAPSPQAYRLFSLTRLVSLLGVEAPETDVRAAPGLGTVAMGPRARDLLDAALELVVGVAADVIDGVDGVSITLPRHGGFATVASSNDIVLGMDHDQYATGQGPCLDAAITGVPVVTALLDQEPRWPEFVPLARARGINSILSAPLVSQDRTLGALNVYSSHPAGVGGPELAWADRFADSASTLLVRAESTEGELTLMADLQSRLHTRDVIAVAQGVLMERLGLSQDKAHASLISTSRRTSVPMAQVCADVIASGAG